MSKFLNSVSNFRIDITNLILISSFFFSPQRIKFKTTRHFGANRGTGFPALSLIPLFESNNSREAFGSE